MYIKKYMEIKGGWGWCREILSVRKRNYLFNFQGIYMKIWSFWRQSGKIDCSFEMKMANLPKDFD